MEFIVNFRGEVYKLTAGEWIRIDCPLMSQAEFQPPLGLTTDGRIYDVDNNQYIHDQVGPFKSLLRYKYNPLMYKALNNNHQLIKIDYDNPSDYAIIKENVAQLIIIDSYYGTNSVGEYSKFYCFKEILSPLQPNRTVGGIGITTEEEAIENNCRFVRAESYMYYWSNYGVYHASIPDNMIGVQWIKHYNELIIITCNRDMNILTTRCYDRSQLSTCTGLETTETIQLINEHGGIMGSKIISNKCCLVLVDGTIIHLMLISECPGSRCKYEILDIPKNIFRT